MDATRGPREQANRLRAIPVVMLTPDQKDAAWKDRRVTNMWPGAIVRLDQGRKVVSDGGFFYFDIA